MLENRNTENAPLDCEDWQIVFEPYAQFPILALVLAQHLTALQDLAQSDAINRAVESLYEQDHSVLQPSYSQSDSI